MRIAMLSVLFAVACGSSQKSAPAADPQPGPGPETAADPEPTGARDRVVAGGDKLWSEMSRKERAAHMKNAVVPAMQKHWAEYDADKYSKITCLLCHGDGVLEGNYDMPSPELPRLNFAEGWQEFAAEHEAILGFMKETVSPGMADLLGLASYSEIDPSGFGCMNCHMGPEN